MLNKLILLLIFIPNYLFSQDTQKITDKKTHEKFYVLKSDKITKHGEYKRYSYYKNLSIKGYYKMGLKDSIWECYNSQGTVTLKYDYNKREVLFYKPYDNLKFKKFKVLGNDNSSDTILSRPPINLNGEDVNLTILMENIIYPTSAANHGKSGTVNVLFKVDKFGEVSNYHVETPLGYGMDQEALRIVKLMPVNWLPGLVKDTPVDVEVKVPIMFRIQ